MSCVDNVGRIKPNVVCKINYSAAFLLPVTFILPLSRLSVWLTDWLVGWINAPTTITASNYYSNRWMVRSCSQKLSFFLCSQSTRALGRNIKINSSTCGIAGDDPMHFPQRCIPRSAKNILMALRRSEPLLWRAQTRRDGLVTRSNNKFDMFSPISGALTSLGTCLCSTLHLVPKWPEEEEEEDGILKLLWFLLINWN